MRCDECGDREAEVHLTKIEGGELRTLHLCEICAESQGLSGQAGSGHEPLADFLAGMGPGDLSPQLPAVMESCPYCGTSPADFRRTGRLGCSHCWVHYENQLRALLRRIHGSTRHAGRLYLGHEEADREVDRQSRLERLRLRLERAIQVEDFETAAHLRDRIRELEPVE